MNLSQIPTPDLEAELARRHGLIGKDKKELEYFNIKMLAKSKGLQLAYERCPDSDYKDVAVAFTLGIFKGGEFLDFYYNSELDYEEQCELIPDCFAESSESVYEFSGSEEEAVEILKKCGYQKVENKN